MVLKILAFIYRNTGWFCPLIKMYEYDAVKEYIHKQQFKLSTLGVSIFIGAWQVSNGLYRSHRRVK